MGFFMRARPLHGLVLLRPVPDTAGRDALTVRVAQELLEESLTSRASRLLSA